MAADVSVVVRLERRNENYLVVSFWRQLLICFREYRRRRISGVQLFTGRYRISIRLNA